MRLPRSRLPSLGGQVARNDSGVEKGLAMTREVTAIVTNIKSVIHLSELGQTGTMASGFKQMLLLKILAKQGVPTESEAKPCDILGNDTLFAAGLTLFLGAPRSEV